MDNKEIDRYIRKNMALFKSIATKIKRNLPTFVRNYDYEDIVQTVLETSITRLKSYDKNKNSNIPNYLYKTAYFDSVRYIKDNFSLIKRPAYLLENAVSFAKVTKLYNYSNDEIINLLQIPKCRLANILAILKGTYEPLDETFLTSYKSHDNNIDNIIDMNRLNRSICNNTSRWNQRDKDILKCLILKEGRETLKTLGAKYNVSRNCIHLRKKALVYKLQKMILSHRPDVVEELLND